MFRIGSALLRLVDHDPLKLFFLVEEVRNVKEGVAFETNVDEGRLHSRQYAHDATFVNVADDSLMLFSTFNVELCDLVVFNDRNLFLASVDAHN